MIEDRRGYKRILEACSLSPLLSSSILFYPLSSSNFRPSRQSTTSGVPKYASTNSVSITKKRLDQWPSLFYFVGATGFEPTTPCSQSRCANRTALRPEMVRSFAKPSAKIRVYGETAKGFRGENRLNGLAGRFAGHLRVTLLGFLTWAFSDAICSLKAFCCTRWKKKIRSPLFAFRKRRDSVFQAYEATVSGV